MESTRILLRAELTCSGQTVIAHTVSLSHDSAFVRTPHRFVVGDRIAPLLLSFPKLAQIETEARVVEHRSALAPGEDEGVLLEFAFRTESERADVADLMSRVAPADGATRTPSRTTPFRVLLVEDSTLIREAVTGAIARRLKNRKQFIAIDHASDGPAALELLRETKYDLAIVDYLLPNLGGATIIKEIRALPESSDIPVIAVSIGGDDARQATLDAGADLFLDKPLMLTDLGLMLERLLAAESAPPKKRVLMIDDSPFILQLLSEALVERSYDVSCVTHLNTLDEALARRPDLLLVDVQMPEVFGDDVASVLRQDRGIHSPIYLFSSLPDEELATRARACEIEGFIPKRIGIEAIVERIRTILGDA